MLGTLEGEKKSRWKEFVKPLVHAYNCTRNDTTGYTPYELMFGRQPRLPVDLAFGLPVNTPAKSHSQYVQNLKNRLRESYEVATKNAGKVALRNKRRFDERVITSTLDEGDRVLVRNVRLRGKQKLADKWEQDVYVVVRKVHDLPVYTVQPEGKDGPFRTLHRDLLLPCGFLQPRKSESQSEQEVVRRPRTRTSPNDEEIQETESISECSESADEQILCYVPERILGSETQIITGHSPCVREDATDLPVFDPTGENLPAQEPVESNLEEPVEGKLDESLGMEICEDEQESHCTPPDISVKLRSEPEQLSELLNESPTQTAEMVPINSELQTEDRTAITDEVSHTGNILNEDGGTSTEDNIGPRRSERERRPPKKFEYPQLGNPLTLVIQSLLQGLSEAFSSSLEESVTSSVIHV
ncbi:uncharacterized protein [Garra rufa]|uniref:uncharacterized protein n=1 Tax=Garra rufa TaxID=137080 RepID=UPI003CCEE6A7